MAIQGLQVWHGVPLKKRGCLNTHLSQHLVPKFHHSGWRAPTATTGKDRHHYYRIPLLTSWRQDRPMPPLSALHPSLTPCPSVPSTPPQSAFSQCSPLPTLPHLNTRPIPKGPHTIPPLGPLWPTTYYEPQEENSDLGTSIGKSWKVTDILDTWVNMGLRVI